MDKTIEEWKTCQEETLGFVLLKTMERFLQLVLYKDTRSQTRRFVEWTRQMQQRGYFGPYQELAPTKTVCAKYLDASELELRRARNFANAHKWPYRAVAIRHMHKVEKFHSETAFFTLELLRGLPGSVPTKSDDALDDVTRPAGLYPTLPAGEVHSNSHTLNTEADASSHSSETCEKAVDRDPWRQKHTDAFLNSTPAGDRAGRKTVSASSRRAVPSNVHNCKGDKVYQLPVAHVLSTDGNISESYTPFSLQDVTLIKKSLPPLERGASAWIAAFLKINAGAELALGDWRRIFSACASVNVMDEIERDIGTQDHPDHEPLHLMVRDLWPRLRHEYPLKLKSAELYSLPLQAGERGASYLQRTRDIWDSLTGEDPSQDMGSVAMLYRGAVESSLPTPIKESLKRVVSLSTMEFPMWSSHVIHYIDLEEDKKEQATKNVAEMQGQLVKTQLQESKELVGQLKTLKQLTVLPRGAGPSAPPQEMREDYVDVRRPPQPRNRYPTSQACFRCGRFGHWQNTCTWRAGGRRGRFRQPPFTSSRRYDPPVQRPFTAPGDRQIPQ